MIMRERDNGYSLVPDGGINMQMVPIRHLNVFKLTVPGMDLIILDGWRLVGLHMRIPGIILVQAEPCV